MSVLLLVQNYTSKKLFICCSRIVYIRLLCQVGPLWGIYIQKTRYQLIYNHTLGRLASLLGLYIWKVVYQLVQDHINWVILHYYWNCTSKGLYISSSKIRRTKLIFQQCSIIGLSIRLFAVFYFSDIKRGYARGLYSKHIKSNQEVFIFATKLILSSILYLDCLPGTN